MGKKKSKKKQDVAVFNPLEAYQKGLDAFIRQVGAISDNLESGDVVTVKEDLKQLETAMGAFVNRGELQPERYYVPIEVTDLPEFTPIGTFLEDDK